MSARGHSCSTWFSVRKGQLIGAVSGALIALAFDLYLAEHPLRFPSLWIIPAMMIEWVPTQIWYSFNLSDNHDLKDLHVILVVIVNTLQGLLIGGFIGSTLNWAKSKICRFKNNTAGSIH